MVKNKNGGKGLNKKQLELLITQFFAENPNRDYNLKNIFRALNLQTHPSRLIATDIIEDLEWENFIHKTSNTTWQITNNTQIVEGVFKRKSNGKNSFIPDGDSNPVFVAERNSMFALDGDRVKVSYMARRQKHIKEAIVIEILKRAKDTFVGKLKIDRGFALLITEGNTFAHDIIIPKDKLKGCIDGYKAIAKITKWPDKESKNVIGEIVKVIGKAGENDTEMHAILSQYNLPYTFSKTIESAANRINTEITEKDIKSREDFRDTCTFTIDPKDAKDFDDALSFKEIKDGVYEIGVHIADVSHYLKEGSALDKEAYQRATSVYLVDRTVPMLPEILSNNVCSLRPNEEKLCYSVIFNINDNAEIIKWRLSKTIIKSNRRFAYEEAQQILEDNGVIDGTSTPSPNIEQNIFKGEFAFEIVMLDMLAKKLRNNRMKNGSVKFDREELHFDIDDKGKPIKCYFKQSKDANKLIEEFMLLANRITAESIGKVKKNEKQRTLPYRIHEAPDQMKLTNLNDFAYKFGYKIKTTGSYESIAKSLNSLIDSAHGKREQNIIDPLELRSMMKAKYSVHNVGHFGLAFNYYTHFTSPIRRYPDIMTHRLLYKYQKGGRSANKNIYEEYCEHSSAMETLAQNAERDSIKYKMVEFMSDKVGNVYDAHISGIQSYGLFCEIDENHCEGLVPIRDLIGDYYDFDERNYCLIGRRTRKKYQLGDKIKIQVVQANIEKRQLDFALPKE